MAISAAYLQTSTTRDPTLYTPEASRRARAVGVWAGLRSLGRKGLAEMIERNCRQAKVFAEGLQAAGYSILNEVVLNQVLVSFGDDATTQRVISEVQRDGTCWCGGTIWHGRTAMRIAPRTMLCGTGWRVHGNAADDRFDELRELCSAAGDNSSLGIATAGLVVGSAHQDRVREAWRLAAEAWALAEAVGDTTLTVGLSFPAIYGGIEAAEWCDVLRWSQTVVDLADGHPSKGNFLVGSPLALAVTSRGIARYCLGHDGWRDDLRRAVPMARRADPASGVV